MIHVLYDNYEGPENMRPAWGFSCLVRGFDKTVLFDTGGDGDILLHNMSAAGVDAESIDAIVLSHNHWDHTGGLAALLQENAALTVYLPETFPKSTMESLRNHGAQVCETGQPQKVCPGIETSRVLGGRIEEQGLCLTTTDGRILLTGCAHPGIAKMAAGVAEDFGEAPATVLGGFHLKDDWNTSINHTIAELKDIGVRRVGPCHCTGDAARNKMSSVYGSNYLDVRLGFQLPCSASG